MNILKHFRGSILLETLVSIVILGLIATGSLYSYSFVHQRILSQRQQRVALSVLQGWMERTISEILNPHDTRDILVKGNELREQFIRDVPTYFYHGENSDQYLVLVEPDLLINLSDNNNMIDITIRITLRNNDGPLPEEGLPIALWTRIYPENH